MFGNRQADARAAVRARTGFIHAVEAVEDMDELFAGNANAGITDGKAHHGFFALNRNGHGPIFGRVLQGIAEQIGQYLQGAVFVRKNQGRVERQV